MTRTASIHDLTGRRVLIPGGTGAVGEGAVRAYLAAGADVVVPTRTQERADEYGRILGAAATEHLHLVVHDYTSFAGAEALVAQMVLSFGGIDDVVAPIGGWWAGKKLWEIDENDWQGAFVGLAGAHMAIARAALPRMSAVGAYTVIVGDSATLPVPGSGLVSMEQAAVLMMQRVLDAETEGKRRVFALMLGPVSTRHITQPGITAEQVGAVAVEVSAAPSAAGTVIPLHDDVDLAAAFDLLAAT